MIKVLIADDHAVVRRGLLEILGDAPDVVPAGEATTGPEVLAALRQDHYDVLVLDIAMPGGGGLEVLQQLRGLDLDLPVLILSVYPEKQFASRAMRAGAAGYLTKEAAPDELVAAIRHAARGETYITGPLAAALAEQAPDGERASHEALSDREIWVMRLLASGQTITEIADDLMLSVKTVSTYRVRLLEKLGLETTADIIRYALDHGLVE